jgi:zinc finger MIZ domain-containing protein
VMINRTTKNVLPPRPGNLIFYQYVQRLALGPCSTPMRKIMYTFEFSVTEEEYALRCFRSVPEGGLLPVENHFDGSLNYRVRCCTAQRNVKAMTEGEWVTSNTQWPVNIFIKVNNIPVFVRRQAHNGKDLPVGITQLIRPGVNRVEVAIPEQSSKSSTSPNFFFGIETVETSHCNRAIGNIKKHGVEAPSVTIDKIKSRLRSVPNGDDEFAILQDSISVDLADPFSARIFKIPVRGAECQHIECFDLYNWLNTRPPCTSFTKNICQHVFDCDCPKSQQPTVVDKWRCPICSKDARPNSLRIDRFLITVRIKLKELGKLGKVKSILVAADGNWKAVDEDEENEDHDSDGGGDKGGATSSNESGNCTANSNGTKRTLDAQQENEQPPRKAARTGSNPNAAASAKRAVPVPRSIDIIEIDD